MSTVTLARQAMATRFEMVLHGDDPVALRAAGEEAFHEVERLEARLSLYRPESEVAHVNARAAREPAQVSPELFDLLQQAQRLTEEAGGAFDITIAPLVRCWGFMGGSGHLPDRNELARMRDRVGMHLVRLSAGDRTVCFEREGVMLDLGAIGKGYAVEQAVAVLREAGVASALIHGGTSTLYALGRPPDTESWNVVIEPPHGRPTAAARPPTHREQAGLSLPVTIRLRDEALSVSAVWGKSFESGGRTFGHVLDPRSGRPVGGTLLSAVVLPSATETDALSTALLVLGAAGHDRIARLRPGMKTLIVSEAPAGFRVEARGFPGQ